MTVWNRRGAVERLRELCRQNLAAEGIATILSDEFDVQVTRCAVIGKTNRLGIDRDVEPRGGVRAGTEAARRFSAIGPAARRQKAAERKSQKAAKPQGRPVRHGLSKAEIRKEFEEAWANTAKLQVA